MHIYSTADNPVAKSTVTPFTLKTGRLQRQKDHHFIAIIQVNLC